MGTKGRRTLLPQCVAATAKTQQEPYAVAIAYLFFHPSFLFSSKGHTLA